MKCKCQPKTVTRNSTFMENAQVVWSIEAHTIFRRGASGRDERIIRR